jgi:hypothetical protein
MDEGLTATLRLAGFALGHAVWSVESGETLCTLAFVELADGSRELYRFEAPDIASSVDNAHELLAGRPGVRAALVFDGYVTPEGGTRSDALLVELFEPLGTRAGRFFQPYHAATRSRIPFIGRAKGFGLAGAIVFDASTPLTVEEEDAAIQAVLGGVREHGRATRWFDAELGPAVSPADPPPPAAPPGRTAGPA